MCDTHVKAPAKLIGKSITCPSCKCYLEVPGTSNKKKIEIPAEPDEYKLRPDEFPVDPPPTRIDTSRINRNTPTEDNKKSARDKLPAFLQIALYPTSVPGLITLAIFVFLPPLIRVASLICMLGPFGWLIALFAYISMTSYMFWYFSFCVHESAAGNNQAPETIGMDEGLMEMILQMFRVIICSAIFLLPAIIYDIKIGQDALYWLIYCSGIIFFPMALLAITMHSSLCGLNPILLVVSIVKTCLQYSFLIVATGLLMFLMSTTSNVNDENKMISLSLALNAIYYYLAIVLANVLGRFYHKNTETLDWQV